jgi:translation initiation factor IF-2
MNLTELARILKINPQELRELLPLFGFDIGAKAIKIDNRTSQKIIKEWPRLMREWQKKKEEEEAAKEAENVLDKEEKKKRLKIPSVITVREFADLSDLPVSKILAELMKNGVFASMNERIDFDTASVIGDDLGLEVILDESKNSNKEEESVKLKDILGKEEKEDLVLRAPVIVVMGHVDHGKTKLLDAIRKTDVVAGEAGGITQHIGAYQVTRKNKIITFIDTPGHEAFTAMRSRGAKVADVAVLVVAADDGVKPQTIEAYKIIEASKVPFIVAINKIDKPSADVNRTKQELSSKLNITPEDWGGKTVCVEVSALEGTGVEDVLDMILLTSEFEEDKMKANPNAQAAGTIIESHVDKGAGPVATILIQNGCMKISDQLIFNGKIYGKVKALKNYKGENIEEAGPSVPAQILGLKILPQVGDILEVGSGERVKSKKLKSRNSSGSSGRSTGSDEENDKVKRLNLVIKADVLGSAEAIEESLEKINTEKVKVKILYKGLGNITEGDLQKADSSETLILGFNVKTPPNLEETIREKDVNVKNFSIIYDLIEYVKEEMKKLLEPNIVKKESGRIKILAIFRTEHGKQILGGKVIEGEPESDSLAEIFRDKTSLGVGRVVKLQSGKQDVNKLEANQECGIQYEGKIIVQEGDIISLYREVEEANEM